MLEEQRAAFDTSVTSTGDAEACAEPSEKTVETPRVDTEQQTPQARWQKGEFPSVCLAARIQTFEASANDPDPNRRGFKLVKEQRAACKWFGAALDVAFDEEIRQVPVNARTQSVCLLIGAGGTGAVNHLLPTSSRNPSGRHCTGQVKEAPEHGPSQRWFGQDRWFRGKALDVVHS